MTEAETKKNLLLTEPRIDDSDAFFEELMKMNEGLSEPAALKVAARLIFVLANHIGDTDIVRQAMAIARPPGS